ncbi:hypothetical protein PIB30_020643 [Stylosanthes scabra]|uniref:Transmembrane protein n=1 Tax=Stylosanthes scabra TaxID=79078 RepID=A0ABU6U7M3_9FABA|nr:hypothetical protein [Stylosanthes scabra]
MFKMLVEQWDKGNNKSNRAKVDTYQVMNQRPWRWWMVVVWDMGVGAAWVRLYDAAEFVMIAINWGCGFVLRFVCLRNAECRPFVGFGESYGSEIGYRCCCGSSYILQALSMMPWYKAYFGGSAW